MDNTEPNDDYAIYFINLGEVGLFYNMNNDSPNQIFFKLGVENHFGYYSFLTGLPRDTSSIALTYCRLFALSRSKLFENLRNYQYDLQNFLMFSDTIMNNPINGDYFCYACTFTMIKLILNLRLGRRPYYKVMLSDTLYC